jgi:hypothetical protein
VVGSEFVHKTTQAAAECPIHSDEGRPESVGLIMVGLNHWVDLPDDLTWCGSDAVPRRPSRRQQSQSINFMDEAPIMHLFNAALPPSICQTLVVQTGDSKVVIQRCSVGKIMSDTTAELS